MRRPHRFQQGLASFRARLEPRLRPWKGELVMNDAVPLARAGGLAGVCLGFVGLMVRRTAPPGSGAP
jgi:hypothetical protein